MTYPSIVELSPHDCVRDVCGENAAALFNDDDELKCILLMVFLANADPSDSTAKSRKEKLLKSTNITVPPRSIEKVAESGFTAGRQPDQVECPACKKQVKADQVDVDLLKRHSPSCPYPHLCSRSVPRELYERDPVKSLVEHLTVEWSSTKRVVAIEQGFHPCLVLIAIVRCYLRHHRKFRNAGELVEALIDMEEVDKRSPVWNVTPIVKTFELPKEHPPFRHPVPVCVPTRLEGEAGGQKVQRPGISENSPPGTLEAPQPEPVTERKNSSRETLLEETMRLVYRWRCKNCGKIDADQLLASCGHLALCSACLRCRTSCPICDFPITETVRVYVS